MRKIMINLFGGPGSTKSTTAAHLFVLLKQKGVNAELVTEYVKKWIWEERPIRPGDQAYFAAKQARAIQICAPKVDVIITDSPVAMVEYYERDFESEPIVTGVMAEKHEDFLRKEGFGIVNVFLDRADVPYEESGRYQSFERAREMDEEIKKFLYGKPHFVIPAGTQAANDIKQKVFHGL